MRPLKAHLFGAWLLLSAASAAAGTIAPGLEAQLRETPADQPLQVLVVLQDQADIRTLDLQLHEEKTALGPRHSLVVNQLRDVAKNTQAPLLAELDAAKANGRVLGYTAHWLINAVVVTATEAAIRDIAARDDVDVVEADLVVELMEPIASKKGADKDGAGIGITPGLVSIRAPEVWEGLGIRGEGTIVGVLDTGVDGTHPALADRWRGNFAPADECWLDAAGLGDPDFPVDRHYHGTHVMGTITGLAPDDTIGVAPGALWIASNCINMSVGPTFDNAVLASLEFMTDPDGDPGTIDDVPDAVQNSWGINENFGYDYVDCDSRWWDAIDNCEAAGVVITWSAGNEGPGSQSLRSPADRATTPYNVFSVGSTIAVPPFTISGFSSRGPAGPNCGPEEYRMKPEICAPGSDIYSAEPGGGYQYLSGTSMAGPHVAGVVALMRSANPDVDVITIKQVIMDTALDLGVVGEDNTYGHGFIDAYEAVLAVAGGLGYVEGTVTSLVSGEPLVGARLRVVDGFQSATTDVDGHYRLTLRADEPTTVEMTYFGHVTQAFDVTVGEDETVVHDIGSTPYNWGELVGFVYGPDGEPVPGATVEARGTPVPAAVAGPDGAYVLTLPINLEEPYDIVADSPGLGAVREEIGLPGRVTRDFILPMVTEEDFESGDFANYPWEFGGNADWVIDDGEAYEGAYSSRSGSITHSQQSTLSVSMNIAVGGEMSFWYKVSSESNYDYLRFAVDGVEQEAWSGEIGWAEYTLDVDTGTHTFAWSYTKDGSVDGGADAGWIDMITFPSGGAPQLTLGYYELTYSLLAGTTGLRRLSLSNGGSSPLVYRLDPRPVDQPAREPHTPVPFHVVAKGDPDPLSGGAESRDQGGPDDFGYSWIDSDEAGGPVYDWIDISGIGSVVGSGDDSSHGPFALGFPFRYYDVDYTEIRVCTNGFLQVEGSSTTYTNQDIPLTSAPNAIICPFWDDLNPNNTGGTIYYYADEADQRFIVQWQAVQHYPSGNPETFQVILYSDGSIVYQYADLSNATSCTVGIENQSGTDGLRVVYNGAYLHEGLAIRFAAIPPVPWLDVVPDAGSVPAGATRIVDVLFDATELSDGTYNANLQVSSNDPDAPLITVPVTLLVGNAVAAPETPQSFALLGAVPNPFNPTTNIRFTLPRDARVSLKLYDVSGRLVRTLLAEPRPAGLNEVLWNGRDDAGRSVASGTYFARLVADGEVSVKSMVLVR